MGRIREAVHKLLDRNKVAINFLFLSQPGFHNVYMSVDTVGGGKAFNLQPPVSKEM